MSQNEFQNGDVAVLNRDVACDGVVFPAGTECIVVAASHGGEYFVEILEPKREIVSVPEVALDPVQP
jgi:hypothetical protein